MTEGAQRDMKTKESFAALLFLAVLAAVTVFYWTGFFPGNGAESAAAAQDTVQTEEKTEYASFFQWAEEFTSGAESAVNEQLDRGHFFIELYGGIERLAGRRVMKDVQEAYNVIRLSDGSLTFVESEEKDPGVQRASFARLIFQLSRRDVPFLYVQAPNKLAPEDQRLPEEVTDYSNAYADGLLKMLSGMGIDTLDLRETFLTADEDWGSYFFKTDHHWTPEGAFLACGTLCDVLREDYGLPISAAVTDPESYTRTVYPDKFLGSVGKRVGTLYGGVDDFTLWSPNFPTRFSYEVFSQGIGRFGSFDTALMFPERLKESDLYLANPYTAYSGGDYPLGRMINEKNPDGPRILLLRDSYACALAPFLALGCGELDTVDLRYFGQDDRLLNYVDWLKPDIVVMMYTAGPLRLNELLKF